MVITFTDILQDNIRTNAIDGEKGLLVEKAGIENTLSDLQSELSEKLLGYDSMIAELLADFSDKEGALYAKFARMETALSQYQAQSGYITSQLGG